MDTDMKDMSLADIIKKDKEQKGGQKNQGGQGQRKNGIRGKFRKFKNYNKFGGGADSTPKANTSV
jgi:hypothetical protein